MYNRPGSIISSLHNRTARVTLPRCLTGQDQLACHTTGQPGPRCITGQSVVAQPIELHDDDNHAQLPLSLIQKPHYLCPNHYHAVLGHDHASYTITQWIIHLLNGPSSYASRQGLGIHAERIHDTTVL